MVYKNFTRQHRQLGRTTALAVFPLTIAYAVALVLGLFSLESPVDPISDPLLLPVGTAHRCDGAADGHRHGCGPH